jgi:osmotically-inducible protein OsmY
MSTTRLRHAVLISVLVAGACSRTDPSLQIEVDQALSAQSETNALSVDISVNRRIVRLSGEVASRDQEQHAVAAARSVPGVRDVVDGLRLSDATIVAAVKQALAADPLVGRIPIEVDASNGNVRLISDQTGPDDRKQAVAIASKIDGVRQVEDRMR